MNLLVGLVLIVCLFVSELSQPTPVQNLFPALLALFLVSVSIPGLAFFQAWFLMRRQSFEDSNDVDFERTLNRMSTCHTAVWLVASLMIVSSLRWQDVVRANWNLDRWPMVDELMLVIPIVLPLFASWLIHASLQKKQPVGNGLNEDSVGVVGPLASRIINRDAWGFASFQFRYLAALFLIPLALVVLLNDTDLESLGHWNQLLLFAATITIVALYPIALLWLWPTKAIADENLLKRIKSFCDQQRLGVFDVRILNTNRKYLNALVVGLLPRTRIILLTDALVERFAAPELMGIVRHEGAHIRLHHFGKRLIWILAPVGMVLGCGCLLNLFGSSSSRSSMLIWLGLENRIFEVAALTGVAYLAYMWFFMRPKAIQMEFEADAMACEFDGDAGREEGVRDLTNALLRMAVYFPSHYHRNSLAHPSLARRIGRISNQIEDEIAPADEEFASSLELRQPETVL